MSPSAPVTLVVGNPRPGSRTHTVAHRVMEHLTAALNDEGPAVAPFDVVDLAQIGALLPIVPRRSHTLDAAVQHAVDQVRRPGLLVLVSPTFKGSYTGLLKLFFDMLPIDALRGSVAVAVMTAGWKAHRSAGDRYLRPLISELGADVPVPSMSILEEQFDDVASIVTAWTTRYAQTLRTALTNTLEVAHHERASRPIAAH